MSSPDETVQSRLDAMEEKINYLVEQINEMQDRVTQDNPELKQVMNMLKVLTSTLQLSKAPIQAAKRTMTLKDRIIERFPSIKYDDISRAIVSSLERKGRLNISQLTEQVRKERGSASRRIVRERVNELLEMGVVEEVDEGYGRQIQLIKVDKEEEENGTWR